MSSRTEQPANGRLKLRNSAKALVTRGDRTLIIKERHADGSVFWTIPGGGTHRNESTAAALRRELFEELQCQGTIEDRVAQYWYAHTSRDKTVSQWSVYTCTLVSSAEPNPTEGILAKRWALPEELPPRTLPQVRYLVERHVSE
ncbi:NUDIX hydrolase [Halovenus sp. HT40]|uniref:NUDIX hydrolase n=1 Tax=Halovenus sp. HT40 TaxID=3126691 RepID=UPI00300F4AC9